MNRMLRAFLAFSVALAPLAAHAAGRTAWTAGNGQGLTWGTVINSADMASMTNGQAVLSSVTGIANGTNLDQFMDISCKLVIASSTVAAGANIAFWIAALQEDASTYGDGQLTSGTAASITPPWAPVAAVPLYAAAAQTTLWAYATGVVIPPGTFRVIMQNNSGFSLTGGTQTCQYRTYNINLNN